MTPKSPFTTHVFDLTIGQPAAGVFIVLEQYQDTEHDWQTIAETKTNSEGRADEMIVSDTIKEGLYRITYDTDAYYGEHHVKTFYSSISINFQVSDSSRGYHIPLLLSPYGYSTYRE